MADELTDRQQSLIEQVRAGEISEKLSDTETQLLALARLGHLTANYREGQFYFSVPQQDESAAEAEGTEG